MSNHTKKTTQSGPKGYLL